MDGERSAADNQSQPPDSPVRIPAEGEPAAAGVDGAPAGGLLLGEDGQPVVIEEEVKAPEEIIPSETMESIMNVWNVFDLQKTHSIEIKHLRTIMRALDFNLNDEEMNVIRKMIDP